MKSFIIALVLIGGFTATANAASFTFQPSSDHAGVGQRISVGVMIDSEGESINTVEGSIVVPENFTIAGISDGSSIINLWVDRPKIQGNTVNFSGIMPGGFSGLINPFNPSIVKSGTIMRLDLVAKQEGSAKITWTDASAYLNDGKGTAVDITTESSDITIKGFATGGAEPADTELPLSFVPELVQDPLLYDNNYAVVFDTRDVDSGIDRYEIKEGAGNWVIGSSPYLLRDQKLSGEILVKAVDRAGNVRIQSVDVQKKIPNDLTFLFLIGIGIVFALIIVSLLHRKHTRKNL